MSRMLQPCLTDVRLDLSPSCGSLVLGPAPRSVPHGPT